MKKKKKSKKTEPESELKKGELEEEKVKKKAVEEPKTEARKEEQYYEVSWKALAAILFVLAAIVVAGMMLNPRPQTTLERQINQTELEGILEKTQHVSVIMNITGTGEDAKNAVMQCAVDVSGSMGRLGKNVSNYLFNGDECVNPDVQEVHISECSGATTGFYFIVNYGPNTTTYYERHVAIEVNEQFGQGCYITRRD